ncbi:MAG: hypothetical protein V8S98_05645 [Lachnospiraceae bacterium]
MAQIKSRHNPNCLWFAADVMLIHMAYIARQAADSIGRRICQQKCNPSMIRQVVFIIVLFVLAVHPINTVAMVMGP